MATVREWKTFLHFCNSTLQDICEALLHHHLHSVFGAVSGICDLTHDAISAGAQQLIHS